MNICYFGSYEEGYSRNQIMIKALKSLGHTVKECHVSLWRGKADKTKTLSGLSNKILFLLRLFTVYPRLFVKYLLIGKHDLIFIGYFGHLDILFAKFFSILTLRRKKIVFDVFLSLYDSMVIDRKIIKNGAFLARGIYWLDRTSCSLADLIILDTYAHIDFFHNTFKVPKDKMVRIFASADSDIFFPRKVDKKDTMFRVLFTGKYIPLHGIEYIVEAAEHLKDDDSIRFTFIGRGQLYPAIRRMVAEKGLGNIEFIEWVEYERLPDYIAQADVCLGIFSDSAKSSRVIPNKVFQAMAMGKPVITGRTPGIAEGINDGVDALLCNVADGNGLAKSILKIKSDRSLQQSLSQYAQETFNNKLGNQSVASSLKNVLAKIH